MLKVLKLVVGVPVGIFALMVVWQLLFGKSHDPMDQVLADCRNEVNAMVGGDPARLSEQIAKCDEFQASLGRIRANPTKIYGPETPAK